MAAQALVRKSYLEPLKTYETNVMGTVNLLEAVRATESIKTIINITSDKCYENKEWNYGYRENDPMGGHDPYSSSKGCSELVTAAYRDSFFNKDNYSTHKVSLASVRAGNVIGGGDWAEDRLLPDCIMSLVENKEIIIRSPRSLRPWQHVLDALNGYLKLAIHMMKQGDKFNEAWNFGPTEGNIISVEELVNKIIDFWGSGTYAIKKTDNLHEATLLKLDINKAMFLLNWKPVLSIDESLQSTIDWYKSYYSNNMDMMEFTINQINLYQKKS
jgi:CDP-glucose 4,6-dehydratase